MIRMQIRSIYYGEVVLSIANGEKLTNLRVIMSRSNIDPIECLKTTLKIYSSTLKERIPLKEIADISYQHKVAEVTHYNLSPVCVLGVRFKGNDISGFYKEQ